MTGKTEGETQYEERESQNLSKTKMKKGNPRWVAL